MADVRYYADHFARAVQALRPFLRRERLVGLVGAFSEEIQQLEDTLYAMVETGGVDAASGDVLDAWGDLVGEARAGLLDGEYRRIVLARLAVNRSTGTVEEVIQILSTITDATPGSVQYFPRFPAGLAVAYGVQAPTTESFRARLRAALEQAIPAGVALEEIVEAVGLPFAFLEYDAGPAGGFDEGFFAEDF